MILVGIAGGVMGGMGMGGGTLLIPLLTIFCGIEQHVAQAINLVAFVPMSIVAIIIHLKNKLIDFKLVPLVALPAVAVSVPAAILAKKIAAGSLKRYFGIFLIVLGIYQLVSAIAAIVKKKKAKAGGDSEKKPEKP